jgi:hypothetical protein
MAIYCENLKLIYFSTPRTGCTSIERLLKKNYGGIKVKKKHVSIENTLNLLPEDNYFLVTNTRNPYDSLVSLYFKEKYQFYDIIQQGGKKWIIPLATPGPVSKNKSERCRKLRESDVSFNEYILDIYGPAKFSQFDHEKDKRINFYITFENIESDLNQMFKMLGVDNQHKLPHANVTSHRKKDHRTYYTPEAIEVVRQKSQNYLDWAQYNFDGKL